MTVNAVSGASHQDMDGKLDRVIEGITNGLEAIQVQADQHHHRLLEFLQKRFDAIERRFETNERRFDDERS